MQLGPVMPLWIIAIGLMACESPLSTSERHRLAEGEAKWAARGNWPTVEQLFSSLRETGAGEWLDDIRFTLDPVLGYPTEISWISSPNVQDAGATQFLRNPAQLR